MHRVGTLLSQQDFDVAVIVLGALAWWGGVRVGRRHELAGTLLYCAGFVAVLLGLLALSISAAGPDGTVRSVGIALIALGVAVWWTGIRVLYWLGRRRAGEHTLVSYIFYGVSFLTIFAGLLGLLVWVRHLVD